jgi:hypothetical protein
MEFFPQSLQLPSLEIRDRHAAPSLTRSNERGIHQFQHRTFAESVRNRLRSPPLFAEEPLLQIPYENLKVV